MHTGQQQSQMICQDACDIHHGKHMWVVIRQMCHILVAELESVGLQVIKVHSAKLAILLNECIAHWISAHILKRARRGNFLSDIISGHAIVLGVQCSHFVEYDRRVSFTNKRSIGRVMQVYCFTTSAKERSPRFNFENSEVHNTAILATCIPFDDDLEFS